MPVAGSDERRRVALVTGATRGLGKEVARQLRAAGLSVLIGARDLRRGEAVVDELSGVVPTGGRAGCDLMALALDVEDDAGVAAAAAAVEARHGRLDVLVNNAGIMTDHMPAADVDAGTLSQILAVNVVGVARVTRAFVPLLARSPGARVLNVSSEAGSLTRATTPGDPVGSVGRLGYMASKAALNALTVVYARALAADGVAVVSVSPGYVATELNGTRGTVSVREGAAVLVRAALGGPGAPASGTFSGPDGPIPW